MTQDQFLPWSTSIPPPIAASASVPPIATQAPAVVAPVNMQSYDLGTFPPTSTSVPAASTQLTRRPVTQMVTHPRVDGSPSYMNGSALDTDLNDQGENANESDAAVEQRALLARKEAQDKRRQIPPFVQKLMSFLNDEKNTPYIRWSDDGNSFIVVDEDEFARTLIPEMFKHNKYPSFVRQLNMYGFHKKVRLSDNSMRAHERKNKSPSEYANPYFKRGRPDLLWLIQKPKGNQSNKAAKLSGGGSMRSEDREDVENEEVGDDITPENRTRFRGQLALGSGEGTLAREQLASVYAELQAVRQQQQIISSTINKIRREHDQLYTQAATFQEQHTRHENHINAILTFLATVYNRSLQGGSEGVQSLMNSFQNAVPQEHIHGSGNVLDMNLVNLTDMGSGTPGQRNKKVPLLLKAAPDRLSSKPRQGGAVSPTPSAANRQVSQRHPSVASFGSGRNIEELVDTSSPRSQHMPNGSNAPFTSSATTHESTPQRDIMSIIQNTNTSEAPPATNHEVSAAEFSDMISPFKSNNAAGMVNDSNAATAHSGEMLRLIADQANTNDNQLNGLDTAADHRPSYSHSYPSATGSMHPSTYDARLASSRAEIENLVKLQAEQDRNVQNLTSMLQPLSPTGAIPGLGDNFHNQQMPQPPIDLEHVFNGDYFANYANFDPSAPVNAPNTTAVEAIDGIPATSDAHTGNDTVDVDDLFNFDTMSTPRMQNNYPATTTRSTISGIVPSPTSVVSDKSQQ
ncbi:hypothetical protein KEM56_007828 [Ascosphaera pollenicola]|nr:hypothetical protein KEM56_007828 [Ascosphaera pollenicola]